MTLSTRLIKLGDEATKRDLEARANAFDAGKWLENSAPSLIELARENMAAPKAEKITVTLYNPYDGEQRARQLGETVDEFLERLPPATTPATEGEPWILIANPYRRVSKSKYSGAKLANEAPPDDCADLAQFVVRGNQLLEQLTGLRHEVEKNNTGKAKAIITKAFNLQKNEIINELLDTAVELHVTTGKVGYCLAHFSPVDVTRTFS